MSRREWWRIVLEDSHTYEEYKSIPIKDVIEIKQWGQDYPEVFEAYVAKKGLDADAKFNDMLIISKILGRAYPYGVEKLARTLLNMEGGYEDGEFEL